MTSTQRGDGAPELLILVGSCVFIFVSALSAVFEADIRWLHFFQARLYLATIILSLRHNRWGYFIGFSVAGLWDYTNIVATNFFFNGLHRLSIWIQTGHLTKADQLISLPACFANLLIVVGCLWAYSRQPQKSGADVPKLLLAFTLAPGFLAGAMALFQPRYLALFPRLLHLHLP